MSQYRFIEWTSVSPTANQIALAVTDFFGKAATVRWEGDVLMVTLQGHCSWPFARALPEDADLDPFRGKTRDRWIEVFVDDSGINVQTRMQDDYTNALADALATLLARAWDGQAKDHSNESWVALWETKNRR